MKTKVFLIGGAPVAGKTTLGSSLARQLGIGSLTINDLKTAALAITTSESHPKLHAMSGAPAADYFTNSTVDQLITDATAQHEAEATEHQMTVLRQTGETSVAELCQVVLDRSEDR